GRAVAAEGEAGRPAGPGPGEEVAVQLPRGGADHEVPQRPADDLLRGQLRGVVGQGERQPGAAHFSDHVAAVDPVDDLPLVAHALPRCAFVLWWPGSGQGGEAAWARPPYPAGPPGHAPDRPGGPPQRSRQLRSFRGRSSSERDWPPGSPWRPSTNAQLMRPQVSPGASATDPLAADGHRP